MDQAYGAVFYLFALALLMIIAFVPMILILALGRGIVRAVRKTVNPKPRRRY